MNDNNSPMEHPITKLLSGIICLIFAFAISGVAAFFSITGLATIFSAEFVSVVIMGGVLETGKLVAAGWLHSNWKNKRVGIFHKFYLSIATIALMIITSIGIYGYLSKAYLDQATPAGSVNVQIQMYQQQIATDNANISRLTNEQNQLDAQINGLITQSKIYMSQNIRKSQAGERAQIQSQMTQYQNDIVSLNQKIEPLQIQVNGTNAKLGPIKYVAALFGWTDLDAAVRLVILIIMFAFDPLAVVLLLSGTISLGEWMDMRDRKNQKKMIYAPLEEKPFVPEKIIEKPQEPEIISSAIEVETTPEPIETEIDVEDIPANEVEEVLEDIQDTLNDIERSEILDIVEKAVSSETSKDDTGKILIQLFEKKPEIMQEVIDIITEMNERKSNEVSTD